MDILGGGGGVLRIGGCGGILGFPIRGLHLDFPACDFVGRDLGHFCRFDSVGRHSLLFGQRLVELYGLLFGQQPVRFTFFTAAARWWCGGSGGGPAARAPRSPRRSRRCVVSLWV